MADILSQDELDALLAEMEAEDDGGESDGAAPAPTLSLEKAVKPLPEAHEAEPPTAVDLGKAEIRSAALQAMIDADLAENAELKEKIARQAHEAWLGVVIELGDDEKTAPLAYLSKFIDKSIEKFEEEPFSNDLRYRLAYLKVAREKLNPRHPESKAVAESLLSLERVLLNPDQTGQEIKLAWRDSLYDKLSIPATTASSTPIFIPQITAEKAEEAKAKRAQWFMAKRQSELSQRLDIVDRPDKNLNGLLLNLQDLEGALERSAMIAIEQLVVWFELVDQNFDPQKLFQPAFYYSRLFSPETLKDESKFKLLCYRTLRTLGQTFGQRDLANNQLDSSQNFQADCRDLIAKIPEILPEKQAEVEGLLADFDWEKVWNFLLDLAKDLVNKLSLDHHSDLGDESDAVIEDLLQTSLLGLQYVKDPSDQHKATLLEKAQELIETLPVQKILKQKLQEFLETLKDPALSEQSRKALLANLKASLGAYYYQDDPYLTLLKDWTEKQLRGRDCQEVEEKIAQSAEKFSAQIFAGSAPANPEGVVDLGLEKSCEHLLHPIRHAQAAQDPDLMQKVLAGFFHELGALAHYDQICPPADRYKLAQLLLKEIKGDSVFEQQLRTDIIAILFDKKENYLPKSLTASRQAKFSPEECRQPQQVVDKLFAGIDAYQNEEGQEAFTRFYHLFIRRSEALAKVLLGQGVRRANLKQIAEIASKRLNGQTESGRALMAYLESIIGRLKVRTQAPELKEEDSWELFEYQPRPVEATPKPAEKPRPVQPEPEKAPESPRETVARCLKEADELAQIENADERTAEKEAFLAQFNPQHPLTIAFRAYVTARIDGLGGQEAIDRIHNYLDEGGSIDHLFDRENIQQEEKRLPESFKGLYQYIFEGVNLYQILDSRSDTEEMVRVLTERAQKVNAALAEDVRKRFWAKVINKIKPTPFSQTLILNLANSHALAMEDFPSDALDPQILGGTVTEFSEPNALAVAAPSFLRGELHVHDKMKAWLFSELSTATEAASFARKAISVPPKTTQAEVEWRSRSDQVAVDPPGQSGSDVRKQAQEARKQAYAAQIRPILERFFSKLLTLRKSRELRNGGGETTKAELKRVKEFIITNFDISNAAKSALEKAIDACFSDSETSPAVLKEAIDRLGRSLRLNEKGYPSPRPSPDPIKLHSVSARVGFVIRNIDVSEPSQSEQIRQFFHGLNHQMPQEALQTNPQLGSELLKYLKRWINMDSGNAGALLLSTVEAYAQGSWQRYQRNLNKLLKIENTPDGLFLFTSPSETPVDLQASITEAVEAAQQDPASPVDSRRLLTEQEGLMTVLREGGGVDAVQALPAAVPDVDEDSTSGQGGLPSLPSRPAPAAQPLPPDSPVAEDMLPEDPSATPEGPPVDSADDFNFDLSALDDPTGGAPPPLETAAPSPLLPQQPQAAVRDEEQTAGPAAVDPEAIQSKSVEDFVRQAIPDAYNYKTRAGDKLENFKAMLSDFVDNVVSVATELADYEEQTVNRVIRGINAIIPQPTANSRSINGSLRAFVSKYLKNPPDQFQEPSKIKVTIKALDRKEIDWNIFGLRPGDKTTEMAAVKTSAPPEAAPPAPTAPAAADVAAVTEAPEPDALADTADPDRVRAAVASLATTEAPQASIEQAMDNVKALFPEAPGEKSLDGYKAMLSAFCDNIDSLVSSHHLRSANPAELKQLESAILRRLRSPKSGQQFVYFMMRSYVQGSLSDFREESNVLKNVRSAIASMRNLPADASFDLFDSPEYTARAYWGDDQRSYAILGLHGDEITNFAETEHTSVSALFHDFSRSIDFVAFAQSKTPQSFCELSMAVCHKIAGQFKSQYFLRDNAEEKRHYVQLLNAAIGPSASPIRKQIRIFLTALMFGMEPSEPWAYISNINNYSYEACDWGIYHSLISGEASDNAAVHSAIATTGDFEALKNTISGSFEEIDVKITAAEAEAEAALKEIYFEGRAAAQIEVFIGKISELSTKYRLESEHPELWERVFYKFLAAVDYRNPLSAQVNQFIRDISAGKPQPQIPQVNATDTDKIFTDPQARELEFDEMISRALPQKPQEKTVGTYQAMVLDFMKNLNTLSIYLDVEIWPQSARMAFAHQIFAKLNLSFEKDKKLATVIANSILARIVDSDRQLDADEKLGAYLDGLNEDSPLNWNIFGPGEAADDPFATSVKGGLEGDFDNDEAAREVVSVDQAITQLCEAVPEGAFPYDVLRTRVNTLVNSLRIAHPDKVTRVEAFIQAAQTVCRQRDLPEMQKATVLHLLRKATDAQIVHPLFELIFDTPLDHEATLGESVTGKLILNKLQRMTSPFYELQRAETMTDDELNHLSKSAFDGVWGNDPAKNAVVRVIDNLDLIRDRLIQLPQSDMEKFKAKIGAKICSPLVEEIIFGLLPVGYLPGDTRQHPQFKKIADITEEYAADIFNFGPEPKALTAVESKQRRLNLQWFTDAPALHNLRMLEAQSTDIKPAERKAALEAFFHQLDTQIKNRSHLLSEGWPPGEGSSFLAEVQAHFNPFHPLYRELCHLITHPNRFKRWGGYNGAKKKFIKKMKKQPVSGLIDKIELTGEIKSRLVSALTQYQLSPNDPERELTLRAEFEDIAFRSDFSALKQIGFSDFFTELERDVCPIPDKETYLKLFHVPADEATPRWHEYFKARGVKF